VPSPSRVATSSNGVGWSHGLADSPLTKGSLAVVECRLGDIFDGGNHELVTGYVVARLTYCPSPVHASTGEHPQPF